jgi:hypothetical protein
VRINNIDFVSQQGYYAQGEKVDWRRPYKRTALSPVRAIPGFRELHNNSRKTSGDFVSPVGTRKAPRSLQLNLRKTSLLA